MKRTWKVKLWRYLIIAVVGAYLVLPIYSMADVEKAKAEGDNKPEYLHKGISARNFARTFTLSENVEVRGATVENGILAVALELVVPEDKQPKKIAITFNK